MPDREYLFTIGKVKIWDVGIPETLFKFPLLCLSNEEIQSGNIQNNVYFFYFPTPFSAGFPHSQDKRAGISKKILSFSTLFLYICWQYKIL